MVEKWSWPAIGIDLGGRFSSVAVWQHGTVEIIMNEQGNRKTPTYVAFTENQCLIGDAAKNQFTGNPANTIFDANKLVGRTFSDVTAQSDIKSWPFKVVAGANKDKPEIVVSYKGEKKQFAAEKICSMVLKKMKETAEAYLGVYVKHAVITVPASFNDSQRKATKDAGFMAGLSTVCVINEPTAAVTAYGLNKQLSSSCFGNNVLVFNLGGRTLDVSLLTIIKDIVEFKVSRHLQVGGDDFDKRMASNFIEVFKPSYGHYISENPEHLKRLIASCERAKRTLSKFSETAIELYTDFLDNIVYISRAKFERLNEDLFKDCMRLVEECLRSAKMKRSEVHHVVLVGGSTRIPKVKQMLQEFFHGKVLCNNINTEETIAYGAAIHAAMLSHIDISPLSFRTELQFGAAPAVGFLVPCKRTRSVVQSRVQESSSSLILQDIDSLLEDLSKVSKKNCMSTSSSKAKFLKLLEGIKHNPKDLQLTGQMSQLLKDFHPSLPMHSLTVIRSLEEDLLASQQQFVEWAKKEAAAPLKLKEADPIQSHLEKIKTKILQKKTSRDHFRSKLAETDKEIAELMDCKSHLENNLTLADEDLCRLTRSIGPQVDIARQQAAQLAHLRETSNFKVKAWTLLEAALDNFSNYFKNL